MAVPIWLTDQRANRACAIGSLARKSRRRHGVARGLGKGGARCERSRSSHNKMRRFLRNQNAAGCELIEEIA
jgi:hypothetical protein